MGPYPPGERTQRDVWIPDLNEVLQILIFETLHSNTSHALWKRGQKEHKSWEVGGVLQYGDFQGIWLWRSWTHHS